MVGNYYITGDKGYKDKDGYIWFDSRGDDVINSSGYKYNQTMIFLKIPSDEMVLSIWQNTDIDYKKNMS